MNVQKLRSKKIMVLVGTTLAVVLTPGSVRAATLTVTNLNDSGPGSLRQAIIDSAGGDTVDFTVTGTITLANGALGVYKSITIAGPGSAALAIDGGFQGRVFQVTNAVVSISCLTIANDQCFCDIGAIYNYRADLTVSNCVFSGNNGTDIGGGAIFSYDAELTVNNCTFTNNLHKGGGIIHSLDGRLSVNRSTFVGNLGSGIFHECTKNLFALRAMINNCTFSGNFYGGGIQHCNSRVEVNNCTFSGNLFGIVVDAGEPPLIVNTILAGNTCDVEGPITSLGHNFIGATNNSNNSSGWTASDLTGSQAAPLNPLLGSLQDNGGPTWTMLPFLGSPLIDAGDDLVTNTVTTDQRGRPRKAGSHVDIGACEVGPGEAIPPLFVFNNNDSGHGSLRQAILDVTNYSLHTVTFASNVTGSVVLTSGELVINTNVTIVGPGAKVLTISGNNASRVFHVSGGSSLVSGLRIANGNTSGGGGGILVDGGATLAVTECTIDSCYAGGTGVAGQGGGGIYVGPTTVAGPAVLNISDSTISSNTTPYYGGGLMLFNNAEANLINCTISGNRTLDNSNGDASGGGIMVINGSTLNIINSTIANNSSAGAGGGIFKSFNGSASIRNTLVAGNSAAGGPDCDGPFVSQGYNLIGNSSLATGFGATGDQLDVNPLLGPLADNGGPTFTHALLAGSPAIDKGASGGPPHDQRGLTRPTDFPSVPNAAGGDGSDIGAFEAQTITSIQYTIVDLGILGGSAPLPNAINNGGQIVGYANTNSSGNVYPLAVFWPNSGSGPLGLGALGGDYGTAIGVSDSGTIVGDAYLAGDAVYHAAIWTNSNQAPLDLGSLGGWSVAASINRFGNIVGYSSTPTNWTLPLFWASATSPPLQLGTLGGIYNSAVSLNDSGQIVGVSSPTGSLSRHAVFWSSSSSAPLDLGTLGFDQSFAVAINNSGQIAGWATGSGQVIPLYWPNVSSSAIALTTLGNNSEALGINASGRIVGYSSVGLNGPSHAVLWNNGTSPALDLNTVVPANSGWVLQSANAINESGEIVGTGTLGEQARAFALTPSVGALRITSVARVGANLQLSFTTQVGHTYNVLGTYDLVTGTWSPVQTGIVGNGAAVEVTIPNAFTQPRQFYRVQQSQ